MIFALNIEKQIIFNIFMCQKYIWQNFPPWLSENSPLPNKRHIYKKCYYKISSKHYIIQKRKCYHAMSNHMQNTIEFLMITLPSNMGITCIKIRFKFWNWFIKLNLKIYQSLWSSPKTLIFILSPLSIRDFRIFGLSRWEL